MKKKKSKSQNESNENLPKQSAGLLNNSILAAVLIFIVSFGVFIPSLSSDFVWDDNSFIKNRIEGLQNADIKLKYYLPTNLNFGGSLPDEKRTLKYYRPVHQLTLIIDAKLWGDSPLGFHLTNIILHSASAILLYFLFLLILKEFGVSYRYQTAFLSGLLFALYPLHVESVSFISARGDVIAATLFFAGFILYILSYRRFIYIAPSALFFYLSFLAKEIALTFPILIFGFDVISRKIKSRLNIYKYLILGSAFVLYLLTAAQGRMSFSRMLSNREYLSDSTGSQLWEIITIFFSSYFFYIQKLIYPFDLNPFIGTIPGGDILYTALSLIVVAALVVVAIISVWKKENVSGYSLLFIFATLGPAVMIAIFPLAITRFAERFLYLPSAGYCLLLGYLIIQAGLRLGRVRLAYACGAVLCLAFLLVTVKGQSVWKNEFTLWEYAILKSPREIAPKMNYASALLKEGRFEEARAQLRDALKPETYGNNNVKAQASYKLGEIYLSKGDLDNAEKLFSSAIRLNPENEWKYNFNMGMLALKKDDPFTAEQYFIKSYELKPNEPTPYYMLGSIYVLRAGMENNPELRQTARDYFESSVRLHGAPVEAFLKLAIVYAELGDFDKAKEAARIAIQKGIQGKGLQDARSILNIR